MAGRVGTLIAAFALACGLASAAHSQQADNPIKSAAKNVAKFLGFATDVPPPADFVAKARPAKDGEYIPIFQPPPEPAKPALNKDQLNALKGDLDSVEKSADAARAAFPPAAKAAADAEAAKQKPKAKTTAPKQ